MASRGEMEKTGTSTAGKSSSNHLKKVFGPTLKGNHGFTLIELVVALMLISLMLFMTIPRLPDKPFVDEKRKTSAWIVGRIQALKNKSVLQAKNHTLHIDLESGRLWTADDTMTTDELLSARQKGYVLPDGAQIQSIEFPGGEKQTSGQAEIWFSKKGYSRMALIHTRFSDDSLRSFLVEPFLPKVKIYERPISFSQ